MNTFFTLKEYLNGNLIAFSAISQCKSRPVYKIQSCLIPPDLVIFLHSGCNFLLQTSALLNIFYPFIVCFLSISVLLLGLICNQCNRHYILS